MVRHERPGAPRLDARVFTWSDPRRIAASIRNAVLRARRRKATPFRAAMSMINSYVRRAGRSLDQTQRAVLERTKDELRRQFGRVPGRRQAHV